MNSINDSLGITALLLVSAIIFIPFFSAVYYNNVIKPFQRKRTYIKMEINRSNDEEYYYWKRQLKRLYVYHIPIVGRFIYKFVK